MSTEGHVPNLRPLGIGEILDVAITITMRHWWTLARVVLVVVVPIQSRLVALIVDNLLLLVVFVIGLAVFNESAVYGLYLLVGLVYFPLLEGGPTGQTLGKRLLGIRVIDFPAGGPIGYGRGVIRYLGRIVSALVCYLGYLWMLWDKEKQCWHDKMATTVVVPVQYYPVN